MLDPDVSRADWPWLDDPVVRGRIADLDTNHPERTHDVFDGVQDFKPTAKEARLTLPQHAVT